MRTAALLLILIAVSARAESWIDSAPLYVERVEYLRGLNDGDPLRDWTAEQTDAGIRVTSRAAWLTQAALAAVDPVQASNAYHNPPPVEVGRVAFTNGWSVRIEDDGSETFWRHRNSPYDPIVDAAQYEQAKGSNGLARARLRAIVRDVIATQAINSNSTGTAAQQIARLRTVADRQASEQLRVLRWLREYVVKDQSPEAAP